MRDGARCRAKWEELELELPLFWSSSSTSLKISGRGFAAASNGKS